MSAAASLSVHGHHPRRVARALCDGFGRIRSPAGALVFVSGQLRERLPDLAQRLLEFEPPMPIVLASGAGVLTERGEVEGADAAAALVWAGGRAEAIAIEAATPEQLGRKLCDSLGPRASKSSASLLFVRPECFNPHVLEQLQSYSGLDTVSGAGTVGDPGVLTIEPGGRIGSGGAAMMILSGLSRPHIRSSAACRLLMPLRPITETRGSMVLGIDGKGALDILSQVGVGLEGQPLIFAVLAAEANTPEDEERPQLLVRTVQGVDPLRGGLLVSDEVRPGLRLAFAVRDASAARAGTEGVAREVERSIAGAAPRFGIYFNCAGRGSSLYGSADVDTRILRARFGDMPMAGMQSSFEIAPHAGKPALQLYTGVLTLFADPS